MAFAIEKISDIGINEMIIVQQFSRLILKKVGIKNEK
jgi:hypothetical protein